MLDLGLSKMALIGTVALIVIGPEKLPRVARTVGTLLGRAQRYVADVKDEVNRAMDVQELRKMKESIEQAGREVEQGVNATLRELEQTPWTGSSDAPAVGNESGSAVAEAYFEAPVYRHPGKKWRLKRGATPQWYKARAGVRRQVQSGAARVARYRPRKK